MLHACEVWLPTERLTKHLCETEPQNPPPPMTVKVVADTIFRR
jgi:hypothetical protein